MSWAVSEWLLLDRRMVVTVLGIPEVDYESMPDVVKRSDVMRFRSELRLGFRSCFQCPFQTDRQQNCKVYRDRAHFQLGAVF